MGEQKKSNILKKSAEKIIFKPSDKSIKMVEEVNKLKEKIECAIR